MGLGGALLIAANESHKSEVKGARDAVFQRATTIVGFPPKTRQAKPFTDLILQINVGQSQRAHPHTTML